MTEGYSAALAAVWLGTLTSISPCPLATNIAAVSFTGRRLGHAWYVLASGLFYALGRMLAYVLVGMVAVKGLASVPSVSYVLQRHMNSVLGLVLLVSGIFLLNIVRIPGFGVAGGLALQRRAEQMGLAGAFLLGLLFALAFCPVSAALFFGGLVPLALRQGSLVFLPLLYGAGTAVPVIGFALLVFAGAAMVGRAFAVVKKAEKWARYVTGAVFILVGIHLLLVTFFGLDVLGALSFRR